MGGGPPGRAEEGVVDLDDLLDGGRGHVGPHRGPRVHRDDDPPAGTPAPGSQSQGSNQPPPPSWWGDGPLPTHPESRGPPFLRGGIPGSPKKTSDRRQVREIITQLDNHPSFK